ncbi:glycosyltransferase family 4 protein [Flavobacteriaceae bacterium]|nr:glycosyltransferase family 4 protein [Flavobacteriaceae bacterium]
MVQRITILLNSNRPGAGLNRIKLIGKGFEELGVEVQWIYLLNTNLKGKILQLGSFLIQCIKLLFLKNSKIWVYGHKPGIVFRLIKKKELIFERTEYPLQLIQSDANKKETLENYKYASKFITCSDALINYYIAYTKDSCKYLKVPAVVDYSKFSNNRSQSPLGDKDYIAYCGDMNNNKDGIHDLIAAFSIISKQIPSITLCLIGTASNLELKKIKDSIADLEITERVVFTGRIPHDEVPNYLFNAKLVALARPDNKQAEGGFPSKLAEYLSTGVPTLVTKVGEIPLYVKHNKVGFLAEPDDFEGFAKEAISILENYNEAKVVAKTGQEFAKSEFDYKAKSKVLADFIFN